MNERPTQPQMALALASGLGTTILTIPACLYLWRMLFLAPNEPFSGWAFLLLGLMVIGLLPVYSLMFLWLFPVIHCPDCMQPLPKNWPNQPPSDWLHWLECRRCGCAIDLLGRKAERAAGPATTGSRG
jgi:hypothetical protein